MSDVLFIPQNETQFQRYVRLLHRSLAKNFKMQVSLKSRSDKFNNFAAESLGFTHGGYQQLQAYWAANKHYTFSEQDVMVLPPYRSVATTIFPRAVAGMLLGAFFDHYPSYYDGFLSEDDVDDAASWKTSYVNEFVAHTLRETGKWHPVYWGDTLIGIDFDSHHAALLTAMINGLIFANKIAPAPHLLSWEGEAFNKYLLAMPDVPENRITSASKARIELRMSNWEFGLVFLTDEAGITTTSLQLQDQTSITMKDSSWHVEGTDCCFDFISVYTNTDAPLTLTDNNGKVLKTFDGITENLDGLAYHDGPGGHVDSGLICAKSAE
ncbi:MAG: hypothetical protein GY774_23695 [Planctomycetes bacterium]|nr:hypothetical protein [Planctomycetota bacterium]